MIVILPSFVGDTRVYSLREVRGRLYLKKVKSMNHARVDQIAAEVKPHQCLLLDAAEPRLIDDLKKMGVWVVGGDLWERKPQPNKLRRNPMNKLNKLWNKLTGRKPTKKVIKKPVKKTAKKGKK